MIKRRYDIDPTSGRQEQARRSEFSPDRAPFARNVAERHETFETQRDGSRVVSESRFEYDRFGNVTRLTEESTGGERITAEISW